MERDLHRSIIHGHGRIPRPTLLPHRLNGHRPRSLPSHRSCTSRSDDLLRHCHISEKIQETICIVRRDHNGRLPRTLHSRDPNQTTTRNRNRIDLCYEARCFRRSRSIMPRLKVPRDPFAASFSVNLADPSGFDFPPNTRTGTGSSLCPLSSTGVERSHVTATTRSFNRGEFANTTKKPLSIS